MTAELEFSKAKKKSYVTHVEFKFQMDYNHIHTRVDILASGKYQVSSNEHALIRDRLSV